MSLAARRRIVRLRNHVPPLWLWIAGATITLCLMRTFR